MAEVTRQVEQTPSKLAPFSFVSAAVHFTAPDRGIPDARAVLGPAGGTTDDPPPHTEVQMHHIVETWAPKPACLTADRTTRADFFAKSGAGMAALNDRGYPVVGMGSGRTRRPRRARYLVRHLGAPGRRSVSIVPLRGRGLGLVRLLRADERRRQADLDTGGGRSTPRPLTHPGRMGLCGRRWETWESLQRLHSATVTNLWRPRTHATSGNAPAQPSHAARGARY